MKKKIRNILRQHYGEFRTNLEREYAHVVSEHILKDNWKEKERWATYNQVLLELKNTIKDSIKIKELQYRLTDDENPNMACIQILNEIKEKTPELERLYFKIKNFK